MRYRLMATYGGVPYEAGIGPSDGDVVLFAACPPPEELGFEPATGHWRKELRIQDVQALWESRPVGVFRGHRCVVLDDLPDGLHIAYLGHDGFQAEQLGYWQVDKGVFELVTAREDVIDVVEERTEYPPQGPVAGGGPSGEFARPGQSGSSGEFARPGQSGSSGEFARPGQSGPFPRPWPEAQPAPSGQGSRRPTADGHPAMTDFANPARLPATGGAGAAGAGQHRGGPGRPDRGAAAPGPGEPGVAMPPPAQPLLPVEAAARAAAAARRTIPPALPRPAPPAPFAGAPVAATPPGAAMAAESAAGPLVATGPAATPADAPPRSRSARRREATQRIFAELADLAAIPRAAYAVGQEVDGAMCLIQTGAGYEVFRAAGGARLEARGFADEESAYFYLFGVLAADAVRTGRLAPPR